MHYLFYLFVSHARQMRGNPSRRLMTVKANEANMTVNTNATRQCVSFQKCYLTICFGICRCHVIILRLTHQIYFTYDNLDDKIFFNKEKIHIYLHKNWNRFISLNRTLCFNEIKIWCYMTTFIHPSLNYFIQYHLYCVC